jgi:hypothetical protein
MHGGLSPDLNSMEQIRRVMRPTDVSFILRKLWADWNLWFLVVIGDRESG